MSDRIGITVIVPRDESLPLDVQGVNLRRRAIDLMGEVASIKENTVRYKGATEDSTISIGGEFGFVSLWQRNQMAALFYADGDAHKEVVTEIVHHDADRREYSTAKVVRDPYA